MTRLISFIVFLFALVSCTVSQTTSQQQTVQTPSNIIFLVGDGMGLSQVSSAYYFGEGEPNFSRFTTIGLSKTSSGSHKITDSGAGANAFSTGQKTYNGSIAVDMDTLPLRTITEELSDKGWSVGLVATSSITHATPAAFYAHVKNRRMEDEIATYLLNSKVDFFAGGGQKFFFKRKDRINYFPLLQEKGFVMDTTSLNVPITDYTKRYGYLLAYDGLPPAPERGSFLLDASKKAIDYLSNKQQPFFLMIEGSQIDWAGHNNEADYLVQEVLDFDKVIGYVLDYAQKQGNTLVVVTADHETGGFTLSGERKTGPYAKVYDDYNSVKPTFSTGGHSGAMVPVFAYGTQSHLFGGVFENTKIYELFRIVSGL
jgi:alkaline phosphatase